MHTTKKDEDLILVAANQTPPKQHQKSIFSKSDAFKKGTMCITLIRDNGFSPGRKSALTKQSLQQGHCQTHLGFSPCKFRL
jgi:hypothetical protein